MKLQTIATLTLASLLAACGGSSGSNAAVSKNFTYGSPQAPSATETSAVSTAQSVLQSTTTLGSSPSESKALAVVAFAETVGTIALGDTGIADRKATSQAVASALQSAELSACATQTANSITFTNCTDTGSDLGYRLNGTISWTTASVTWDITGNFSGTSGTATYNLNLHQVGTMTVGATTISGTSTSDFSGSVSAEGQTVNFGLGTAIVLDLTYQSTPSYCVTAGTMEVKRVWTQKPQGASGSAFADAAVKVSWTGCNAFQVAHGT